jgi:transposase
MRKSRLSEAKQAKLIEHFVAGTTARCAADLVGVNRNTAAYYFQRLRDIIAHHVEQEAHEIFEGEIEVDESYFGGCARVSVGEVRQAKCPYLGY